MSDELDELRQQYPGWQFGTVWTTAGSGPDHRRIWAQCETILLTGRDAAQVRQQIAHERETARTRVT
jgi:hypothetical protein